MPIYMVQISVMLVYKAGLASNSLRIENFRDHAVLRMSAPLNLKAQ